MKPSLLITGAGGFLGRHLLEKLDYSKYQTVYCLTRKMENVRIPQTMSTSPTVKVIEGDIIDAPTYETILQHVHTVIHLAAATGKVNPKEYFNINTYGTMLLVDRCKKANVNHFLFVSSIAVSFKNKYRYFYAQSKEQAEQYVKNSGLKFTILRPTMIMGKGSPVFQGLARLAGLPVIPVFGDGDVEIQPVHVEDVAKAITRITNETTYQGEILELGGPEPLTIENFMKKVALAKGKESPRVMHLPLSLVIFFLAIMERLIYMLLPLTVGQLASFRNDGTPHSNTLMKKLTPMMITLDELIRNSLEEDHQPLISTPLTKECRTFCRYLVKQNPNAYVLEKYHQCHQTLDFKPMDFHDKLLLKLARLGFFFPRMIDAYSRFFRPRTAVRKKLAYLVAILEVTPPYFRYYDTPDHGGKFGLIIKAGINGMSLALHLLFSFIFLFPLQLLARLKGNPNTRQAGDN
ncbi:MAG: NAD-dependent epimerase/dehydratase family protein [bacterium]|nr:NAD-dependent epimerase/dehydratase family protein [bacterium]